MPSLFASKDLVAAQAKSGKLQSTLTAIALTICTLLQKDPVKGDVTEEAATQLVEELQTAVTETASTHETAMSGVRTGLLALLPKQEGEDTRTVAELLTAAGTVVAQLRTDLATAQAAAAPEAITKLVNSQLAKAGAEPIKKGGEKQEDGTPGGDDLVTAFKAETDPGKRAELAQKIRDRAN